MKTQTKLEHITVFRIENEISLDKILEYHNTLKNSLEDGNKKFIRMITFLICIDVALILYILVNVVIEKMQLHGDINFSVSIGIILLIGGLIGLLKTRKRAISNLNKRPIREELLQRCLRREYTLKKLIVEDLLDDPSEITLNFLREKRILK